MRAFMQNRRKCIKRCKSLVTGHKQSGLCWNSTNPRDYNDDTLSTYDWKQINMFQHTLQVASVRLKAAQLFLMLHMVVSMLVWNGSATRITAGSAPNWTKTDCWLTSLGQNIQYCFFVSLFSCNPGQNWKQEGKTPDTAWFCYLSSAACYERVSTTVKKETKVYLACSFRTTIPLHVSEYSSFRYSLRMNNLRLIVRHPEISTCTRLILRWKDACFNPALITSY